MTVVDERFYRDVRVPPRPPFTTAPYRDGRRVCPMCGELSKSKRGWWHQECAETWHYAAWPQTAIALLTTAHGDRCWSCCRTRAERIAAGVQPSALELEHIRPLWSLTPTERLELKWWLPFNLQLLCRECHRAKTAAESRERFDLQRAREFDDTAAAAGLQELGLVPDQRRVIRRAS